MRLLSSRIRAAAVVGTLLAAGCNNNPPKATPAPPPVTVSPPVVAPPVVAPPVVAPPVVAPPGVVAPPAQTGNTAAATPPAAAVTNAQPDLVKFGYDWTPKGPYHVDYAASDRPKLAAADNDALITKVLSDLEAAANDAALQEEALVELKRANRDERRRAEVSQRLEPLLGSPAQRVQILAVQSCSTWGTTANVPTLKKLAQRDDPHVSIDAVWAIYCTAGIAEVAPYLALRNSYHGANRAFVMERAGEELIWPLLTSPDPTTVYQAMGPLYQIGTGQSVSHLAALKQHPDLRISRGSQAAINEIQKRQK